jgi:uncharacterized protein YecE (DUF72 family)
VASPSAGAARVSPAVPSRADEDAARALPRSVRLGTSSWTFPGWSGIVWAGAPSARDLVSDGLAAYAAHPLLRAAGVDRSFYGPVDAATFAGWARQVPADFRFLVKAHEACTTARWARHPRHGAQQGAENALFLDPLYAADRVVGPAAEGLGDRLGVILFQFPPQDPRSVGGPQGFAERLHGFLSALPKGPAYAVEIRNPALLSPDYAFALGDAGAAHGYVLHPTMPDVGAQRRVVGPPRGRLVERWMLGAGLHYEDARALYAPFDRLAAPDDAARDAVASLVADELGGATETIVVVNNKAEGSAPLSVSRLARAIAERR